MLPQCIAGGLICVSSVYILQIQHILVVLMAKSSHHPLLLLCSTCNLSFMNCVLFLDPLFLFFLGLPGIPGYPTALSEFLCRPDFEACKS